MKKNKNTIKSIGRIILTIIFILLYLSTLIVGLLNNRLQSRIVIVSLCAFSTFTIWSLKLSEKLTTKLCLILCGVDGFLCCTLPSIYEIFLGDLGEIHNLIFSVIIFAILIGVPVLVAFRLIKKNGYGGPFSHYDKDKSEKKKIQIISVGKRSLILSELSFEFLKQTLLSLVLFIVIALGFSLKYRDKLSMPPFYSTELDIACKILIGSLTCFAFFSFWFGIAFARFKIIRVNLGDRDTSSIEEYLALVGEHSIDKKIIKRIFLVIAFLQILLLIISLIWV